jgi:stage V sporulation protein G
MEVTSINIKVVDNEMPVVAYCSLVLADSICIRKIRIISKGEVYHVCMPSIKSRDGSYADVVHPINANARKKIVTAILNAYLGQLKSEAV